LGGEGDAEEGEGILPFDIRVARADFKKVFTSIGEQYPEH